MMTMMMKLVVLALLSTAASAFTPNSAATARPTTNLAESFGFDFAEDTYENQPDLLKGEAQYKEFVGQISDNPFLTRQYNAIRRVRELDLLGKTADAGLLSNLEAQGLDLETVEKLLPLAEELGLLSLVGKNQQLLINLVAPLLIEPAPILLPLLSGAVAAGPSAFYTLAAGSLGLDAFLFATNAEVPFVGLSAGVVAGLLLVPLGAAGIAAGSALGSLNKK